MAPLYLIHYFHIHPNTHFLTSPLQKKLDNHYFQFLLGITVVLREIEDNDYVKFGGGGGGGKQVALWSMFTISAISAGTLGLMG